LLRSASFQLHRPITERRLNTQLFCRINHTAKMAGSLKTLSSVRAFAGRLHRFEHLSETLGDLQMKFAIYIPDQAAKQKIPTLFYLSGLTCTDENVSQKGCIGFKYASELGIALVMPDTSPRGHAEIPTENDAYDFGTGAGFYLNATKEPWSKHYNMYDYVVKELPALLASEFGADWYTGDKISIAGHSMGGHGALTIGLKNADVYKSVSAFAPIVNPMSVPWGKKAFEGYLNDPAAEAREYDACELLKAGKKHPAPLLVDQGTADNFYCGDVKQLEPEVLQQVCQESGQALDLSMQEGYDHSYWFISSFFEKHLNFHAKYLL